jgi:hypothetical protein
MSEGLSKRGAVSRMVCLVLGAICGIVGLLIASNPAAVASMKPDQASAVGGICAFVGIVTCIGMGWNFQSLVTARKDYLNAHTKYFTDITSSLDEDQTEIIVVEEVDPLPDARPDDPARPERQAAVANVKQELRQLDVGRQTSNAIIPTGDSLEISESAKRLVEKVAASAWSRFFHRSIASLARQKLRVAQQPTRVIVKMDETGNPITPTGMEETVLARAGALVARENAEKGQGEKQEVITRFVRQGDAIDASNAAEALEGCYAYTVYCEPFVLDCGISVKRFLMFTEIPEPVELEQVNYSLKHLRGLPPWMTLDTRAAKCWVSKFGQVETTEETIPLYIVTSSHRMAHDFIRVVIADGQAHWLKDDMHNRQISLLQTKVDEAADDHNALVQRAEEAEANLDTEKTTNKKLRKQIVEEHARQAEETDNPNPVTVKMLVIACVIFSALAFFVSHAFWRG